MADPPGEKKEAKPSAGGGIREKIKKSSKEELETLALKLLDSLKSSKELSAKLEKEKNDLSKQVEVLNEEKSQLGTREVVPLKEKSEEDELGEKEWRRMRDDLEASTTMCAELRSQLEDSRAEIATLRETRASADVFTLELADYEKKVSQLTKSLKETTEALEMADSAKESLAEELSRMKEESGRTAAEGEKAKEDVHMMRRMATEEKTRLAEMQLKVDEEKRKTENAQGELNKERVALGRQLASCQERANRMEEIVDALREENGRLRVEREAAQMRYEELNKDYEGFKNRARYVLEQKKEQEENVVVKEAEKNDELEKKEKELHEVKEAMNILRDTQRRCENDLTRANEQLERMGKEVQQARREAEEATTSLAKNLDELRDLRLENTRNVEVIDTWRNRETEMDTVVNTLRNTNEKLSRELNELSEKSEQERRELEKELTEEKRRRDELKRQLDERREQRSGKTAPVAAVFPQLSDVSSPHGNHSPDNLYAHSSQMECFSPQEGPELTPERELESVLFGEDSFEEGRPIDEDEVVENTHEEVIKLRQQLRWLRELHTDSETNAANMVEQIAILKDEIRRLQRNSERTWHVEGKTEYLKNVIVKFISPQKVSGERAQLLPILQTMLKLSPEETSLLQRVAESGQGGVVGSPTEEESTSSWSALLPRWS